MRTHRLLAPVLVFNAAVLSFQPVLTAAKPPGKIPVLQAKQRTMAKNEASAVERAPASAKSGGQADKLRQADGPMAGQVWTLPGLDLALVPIAPGSFEMGTASGGDEDELPVTRVTLSRAYWLGATEVTQKQWEAVMGNNPSKFKGSDLPAEKISWEEAMAFCRKVTERERAAGRLPVGYEYTLPTEAQWEYACRAGTTDAVAGNLDAMGWYDENSDRQTHAVAQKQANAWGLYDMHGNVWEWCFDRYQDKYPGGSVTDPTGAASGPARVSRGGGWWFPAFLCRSATRSAVGAGERWDFQGFRLALRAVR